MIRTVRLANRAGFTLIELLVVIAIVAILASLLVPALVNSKERARALKCMSNGRQIGIAVTMYGDSASDILPDRAWAPGPHRNTRGQLYGGEWKFTPAAQLEPFLNNSLIWVCPTKRRGLTYRSEKGTFDPSITGFLSYGFNYLGVFVPGDQEGPGRKFTSIRNHERTIAVTECNGTDNPADSGGMGSAKADAAWLDEFWAYFSYPHQVAPRQTGSEMNTNYRFQAQMKKHQQRVNVHFLDGHAEFLRPSRLVWGQFFGEYHGTSTLWDQERGAEASVGSPTLDASDALP